jgi:hypothetical protein
MNKCCLATAALAAAALAFPAGASALPAGGVYTGNVTTPNGPQPRSAAFLRLSADPTKPADAGIYYIGRCPDGSVFANVYYYDRTDKISRNRLNRVQRFDAEKLPDGSTLQETATTRLTFTDTTVRGTFRVQAVKTLAGGQTLRCDTGTMRVALRRSGAFGGRLAKQAWPATLTTTSRSARLALRVTAPCKPAGELGRSLTIQVPLSRRGRFDDDGRTTYTQASNGTRVTLNWDVAGTVGRTRATGTIRVRATTVRADGTAGPTCDSGVVRMALAR